MGINDYENSKKKIERLLKKYKIESTLYWRTIEFNNIIELQKILDRLDFEICNLKHSNEFLKDCYNNMLENITNIKKEYIDKK